MALKKLEELGYKPKKGARKDVSQKPTEEILKEIQNSEAKQEILELLLEALSEPDPREIMVYGMYVKKVFCPIIRAKQKDHIEKIMEMLKDAIGKK
jgi:hypothetical protein